MKDYDDHLYVNFEEDEKTVIPLIEDTADPDET